MTGELYELIRGVRNGNLTSKTNKPRGGKKDV